MRRWKTTGGPRPVAVECEAVGYPNQDADGDVQYANTHFDTEEAAWECLMTNLAAGVELGCSAVRGLRAQLARAEAELVDRTLRHDAARRTRDEDERTRIAER